MATKKTGERSIEQPSKGGGRYGCPNQGKLYNLEGLVRAMAEDQELAVFIKGLLCKAHSRNKGTSDRAIDCLDTYCKITETDLEKLCIPKAQQAVILAPNCTDRTTKAFLLDVPAFVTEKMSRRKEVWGAVSKERNR